MGTAMLALCTLLRTFGMTSHLAAAWYCETDLALDQAIQRAWSSIHSTAFACSPFRRASGDVWDLLLGGGNANALQDMLNSFPFGALLIIIAGSPCQDLTTYNALAGALGLCGPRSVLFFAIPTIAYCIQEARPDLIIHFLLENTATMLHTHRAAICNALRITDGEAQGWVYSDPGWTLARRKRILFSSLPQPAHSADNPLIGNAFDEGWYWAAQTQQITSRKFPTFLRSRGEVNGQPITSAYQLTVNHLIFRSSDWGGINYIQLGPRIRATMPPRIAEGWDIIQRATNQRRRDHDRADESAADDCARWIAEYGPTHGFRPLNASERARILGMGDYCQTLGLTETELFDATGNAFIPHEIAKRLTPIVDHLAGDANLARHKFRSPASLLQQYRALHAAIGAPDGALPCPFPHGNTALADAIEDLIRRYRSSANTSGRALTDIDAGNASPGTGQILIAGIHITRGTAGNLGHYQYRSNCVPDAVLQALLEIPPASAHDGDLGLVLALGEDIRAITGIAPAETLYAADAWGLVCTMRYGLRRPRPILIEAVPDSGTGDRSFRGQNIAAHGSYGPWDGTFCIVATTDGHTEPCTWSVAGYPLTGQHFCLPAGRDIGPTHVGIATGVTYVQAVAAAHGYWIKDSTRRGSLPAELHNATVAAASAPNLTRTFSIFQESTTYPELADFPVNREGCAQIAVFLMPAQEDPLRMQRNETGTHPAPTVHGVTRHPGCDPADVDRAAAIALFFTAEHIYIGTRRDDPLWWAIRGRHTPAIEDDRLTN